MNGDLGHLTEVILALADISGHSGKTILKPTDRQENSSNLLLFVWIEICNVFGLLVVLVFFLSITVVPSMRPCTAMCFV